MSQNERTQELLDYLQSTAHQEVRFDEAAIAAAYQKSGEGQSLAIKILSVFGGILASIAFLGFLVIAGLYRSGAGLIAFGAICTGAAVWINKAQDKIIMDTLSISFFIIGFILLGVGFNELDVDENMICIVFIAIALCTLAICQNYMLSFISVLIIHGSLLTMINVNDSYDLIHVYVSALTLATTYVYLNEARIITTAPAFSKLYDPVRIGLIFSLLAGLVLLGKRYILPVSVHYIWASSVLIIAAIAYVLSHLFRILHVSGIRYKAAIYIISLLLLLPTAASPAISGALLIILLSFLVNHKTGLVIGIAGFVYFLSQFYYDLNFTLLTKSILLMASGLLMIVLYLFTRKNLSPDEQI